MRKISSVDALGIAVLLTASLGLGCETSTILKCPDGRPVVVFRDCAKGFEIYALEYDTKVKANLKYLETDVGADLELKRKVQALADKLSNATVRFRTAFVAMCQSGSANPCDSQLQNRLLDLRTKLALEYERLATEIEQARARVPANLAGAAPPEVSDAVKTIESHIDSLQPPPGT
jgi:hypothetical protein